jgi:hypothetical protein
MNVPVREQIAQKRAEFNEKFPIGNFYAGMPEIEQIVPDREQYI